MSQSEQQLKKVQRVSAGVRVLFNIAIAFVGIGIAMGLIGLTFSESLQFNVGNGEFVITFLSAEEQLATEAQQVLIKSVAPERSWSLSLRVMSSGFDETNVATAITPGLRILGAIMALLNASVIMVLLNRLVALFQLYQKGDVFSERVVRRIRLIGIALLGFPLMSLINSAVSSLLVSSIAPDAYWIDVSVNFSALLAATIVIMISWIMDVGRAMREENELTI